MRALIIAPSWIGDTVMAHPLFARLKTYHPELQLDAFAPSWVAPVLRRMPEIAQIHTNPFPHGALALRQRWQLGRALRPQHYQRCYVLPNSLKSALLPAFAGIPQRIGFLGEMRYGLLTDAHTLNPSTLPLMVERFAQLAETPGAPLPRPIPYPKLTSSKNDQTAIHHTLGLTSAPIIAFCPGAEYGPAKRWPSRHFGQLARLLGAQGYQILLLGGPKDQSIGDEIMASAPGACRNLCGHTSLENAVDLLAQSALVICNDSGLMHVAAAVDRPIIALYGSSSPGFTPPLSDHARVVTLKLECSPCFKRDCPLGHLGCLEDIRPESIFELCQEILA